MIAGQIVLEGFHFQVVEGNLPKVNPDGTPTGETTAVKSLLVKDAHSMVTVELRMTPDGFDEFYAALAGRKVIVPTQGLRGLSEQM